MPAIPFNYSPKTSYSNGKEDIQANPTGKKDPE
jgi:hypothetical protein